MATALSHPKQQTDSYLSDLLEKVAEEWRPEFQRFVETGEAEERFLSYLNTDPNAQEAVESAFDLQAATFEGLAAELKNSTQEAPAQRSISGIAGRLAAVIEAALHTPSVRRERMVETSTAELAASMPADELDKLKEVVLSLDTNLTKVVGV